MSGHKRVRYTSDVEKELGNIARRGDIPLGTVDPEKIGPLLDSLAGWAEEAIPAMTPLEHIVFWHNAHLFMLEMLAKQAPPAARPTIGVSAAHMFTVSIQSREAFR